MSLNHQIVSPSGVSIPSVVPFGRSVTCRCSPVDRSHAYSSYVPVALETNSARSGASSAQSGNDTRGARKRCSHSGTESVVSAGTESVVEPVISVMPPFCAGGRTLGPYRPQPVDNSMAGGGVASRTPYP